MAMEYCNTCDRYIDLDYEDGYYISPRLGYMCQSCLAEEDEAGEDFVKPKVPFSKTQRFDSETGEVMG